MRDKIELGVDGPTLRDYIGNLHTGIRERTFETIFQNAMLKEFFTTPEGKLIANHYVKKITDGVNQVVDMLMNGGVDEKKTKMLITLGNQISVTLGALKEVAGIMLEGERHIKNINSKKEK